MKTRFLDENDPGPKKSGPPTVTLADEVGEQADRGPNRTTAHQHLDRFYRAMGFQPVQIRTTTGSPIGVTLEYRRKKSIVEQLEDAQSLFQVEMILKDALLFAGKADKKTKARWAEAAQARVNQLMGVL